MNINNLTAGAVMSDLQLGILIGATISYAVNILTDAYRSWRTDRLLNNTTIVTLDGEPMSWAEAKRRLKKLKKK